MCFGSLLRLWNELSNLLLSTCVQDETNENHRLSSKQNSIIVPLLVDLSLKTSYQFEEECITKTNQTTWVIPAHPFGDHLHFLTFPKCRTSTFKLLLKKALAGLHEMSGIGREVQYLRMLFLQCENHCICSTTYATVVEKVYTSSSNFFGSLKHYNIITLSIQPFGWVG